jgi:hypothetical protein
MLSKSSSVQVEEKMLKMQAIAAADLGPTPGTVELVNAQGQGKLYEVLLNFENNDGTLSIDIVIDGIHFPKTFESRESGLYYLTGLLCHADNSVSPSPLPEDGGSRAMLNIEFADSLVITITNGIASIIHANAAYGMQN